MRKRCLILLLSLTFSYTSLVFGESTSENNRGLMTLENQYIKIFVNSSSGEIGRFALDTNQGDPNKADDDHQSLIYGHPKPWTSFTTINLNGQLYVFGKKTVKRSGAGLLGGEIIEPPHLEEQQIITKTQYGSVIVEQILSIVRSPSTGALDTAQLKYRCYNQGSESVKFGLRTLLDTMIGNNDGAPFRLGEREINYEYSCEQQNLPDFWQAFDSLTNGSTIMQGTLRGIGVTPPDRLVFINWGKAADHPWDLSVELGTSFLRLGEEELDSAVAMFWEPRVIEPGQRLTITTTLGLGGITFAPGEAFLGISAPAEVQYNQKDNQKYTIVAYLEHRGEASAHEVKISLDLPPGLECLSQNQTIELPELLPGMTKQFAWEIRTDGSYQGETGFQISVLGKGLTANQVTRKLKIVGGPLLAASIIVPEVSKRDFSTYQPFKVSLQTKNIGESLARDLKATLVCEAGLALAAGECQTKYLDDLEVKAGTAAFWQITPLSGATSGKFKLVLIGEGVAPLTIPGKIVFPVIPVFLRVNAAEHLLMGEVYTCEIELHQGGEISQFDLNLKYDPKQLKLVNLSRGDFLIEDESFLPWSAGKVDPMQGIITRVSGSRKKAAAEEVISLVRLNFMVIGSGEGAVSLTDFKLLDAQGKEIASEFVPIKYSFEEVEK